MSVSLKQKIESILFISPKPLAIKKLASTVGEKLPAVKTAVTELQADYADRGIAIKTVDDTVQMMTSGATHELAQDFVKDEMTGELTKPSLETLTVIAYRGPVTKIELEMIRGVNCSLILRNLMMRGLIEESVDQHNMPRYQVTMEFMKYIGLDAPEKLPDYDKLNQHQYLQDLLNDESDSVADEAAVETT